MRVHRKPPLNLVPSDTTFFEHEFEKEIPRHEIYRFDDAIVTPDAVVISKGSIVSQSLYTAGHVEYFKGFYALYYRISSILQAPQSYLLLAFDAWSFGYFHWMTEFIPRLFKAKQHINEATVLLPFVNNGIWNRPSATKSIVKLLSGTQRTIPNSGYFTESLDVFNISSIYRHQFARGVKAKKLLVSGHVAQSGNYDEGLMRSLRQMYFGYYNIYDSPPSRLIYVSRSKAKRRYVINEKQVITALESVGFESVVLEELSFPDQVRLFSQVRCVVAQHGAALTNMMFMREGSFAFELKSSGDSQNLCYFSLASAMQVGYLYQFCESDGRNVQDADIMVDLTLLQQNIRLMLRL